MGVSAAASVPSLASEHSLDMAQGPFREPLYAAPATSRLTRADTSKRYIRSVWEVPAVVRTHVGPDGRYITGQTIHVNDGGFMP